MNIIKYAITGTAPLLMHSDRFSNPLDPLTKEHKKLTSIRKKTDDIYLEVAKSEWRGSLYYDNEGIYIPSENIEACIIGGARLNKLGKHFQKAAIVVEDKCYLTFEHDHISTDEFLKNYFETYNFAKSVVVSRARIMRYRPIFREWSTEFTIQYNPDVIDYDQINEAVINGGSMVGLCDWRPKFGRFSVEILS